LELPGATDIAVLAYSPDGKLLAGRSRQTVFLWDPQTGKEVRQIKNKPTARTGGVAFTNSFFALLAFGPDSKTLAFHEAEVDAETRNVTTYLKLADVETGKDVRRITVEEPGLTTAAFAPDGKLLAYANRTSLCLVDADSGKEVHRLQGHTGGVGQIAFSPDGKTLVSRGQVDRALILWDVAGAKELRRLGELTALTADSRPSRTPGFIRVRDLALSPDSKVVASADGAVIRFWEAATGKELLPEGGGHVASVSEIVVSADRKTVVTRGADGTVCRWDAITGKELSRFRLPASTTMTALSPDGRTVVCADAEAVLHLHDLVTGKELHRLNEPNDVAQLGFSPDGKILGVRGRDATVCLYDPTVGKELRRFPLQGVAVETGPRRRRLASLALAFSPDGKLLAVPGLSSPGVARAAGPDAIRSTVNLYEVSTGKELRRIPLPGERSLSRMVFSPDGRALAIEGPDHPLTIWEVASGKDRLTLGTPATPEPAVTSGSTGGGGGTSTGTGFAPLAPSGAAFALDGSKVASFQGSAVHVWDAATGKSAALFKGQSGSVTALAFSPDGKVLASGGTDTTVLLWDTSALALGRPAQAKLSEKEMEAIWSNLAGDDAARAYASLRALASAPAAASFLKQRLQPAIPAEQKLIDRLINDLQSEKLAVRKKAAEDLEKLGDLAVPALKSVLANDPPLDLRKRVDELLGKLIGGPLSGEQVRLVRAIEALELLASPEARSLLQTLARGAPGALATCEAQAALDRLAR
jgi:WD40 repeat protein